jgi:hypothetical protein
MAVLVAGAVVLAATVADRGGVMQVAAAGALVVVPVALDRINRTRLPRIRPGWAARDNGGDLQGRLEARAQLPDVARHGHDLG